MISCSCVRLATVLVVALFAQHAFARGPSKEPVARFGFGDSVEATFGTATVDADGSAGFGKGLSGKCLHVGSGSVTAVRVSGERMKFAPSADFSVSFWIRMNATDDANMLVIGNKSVPNLNLQSQKKSGWMFGLSHGTWMWNIGSGKRRLLYSRDNGSRMRANDGRWHQLAMSFDHFQSVVRLFFDGVNVATYNVVDSTGFDFSSDELLTIGGNVAENSELDISPEIKDGAQQLQKLVNAFNELDLPDLKPDELMQIVIEPERFAAAKAKDTESEISDDQLAALDRLASQLMRNPYTRSLTSCWSLRC
ncbi:MAG: LamG domain-containing protein [Planctomycetota bacterium]